MPNDSLTIQRRTRCVVTASLAAVLVATLGLPSSAGAQGGAISGMVRDSALGIGIAGADVRIEGTAFRAITDQQGSFRFAAGTASGATLRVRRLGFVPRAIVLTSEASQLPVEITLTAAALPLPTVTVRAQKTKDSGRLAGYYERLERRSIGQFITRADLDRERPSQITDMIQRAPGVSLQRGRPGMLRVRMRGRDCSPLIWVDGAALSEGDVDLDAFSPTSLEGVEMYLGAASAPQRVRAARGKNECGAILFWSGGPDPDPPAYARGVDPSELEALIASFGVFSAEQVDVAAVLDSASLPLIEYPQALRASGVSGVVLAEFVVDSAGEGGVGGFRALSPAPPPLPAGGGRARP